MAMQTGHAQKHAHQPETGQSGAEAQPAAGERLLHAEGVSVVYGGRAVVEGVDLSLEAGRILTVIGPNGAGKSTLLRVLMGLIEPDSGTVWRKPGLRMGYLPQRLHVDPVLPLTVERFLAMAPGVRKSRISEALGDVGARALRSQMLYALSGGELQRVLLARALLREPELLILDEPVQGVDVTGQLELYRLIGRLSTERNCAVLMVSHDLHLVMASTDKVLCLNHHVCCQGHPDAVVQDPGYLHLFGPHAGANLAVYTHQHDHVHPEPHLPPKPEHVAAPLARVALSAVSAPPAANPPHEDADGAPERGAADEAPEGSAP